MAEGYECDRCGSLNSGEPHTMVALGDGIPRRRVRGLHPTDRAEGLPPDEYDEVYDLCPGCRTAFESWFRMEDTDE
jgi:hypothetical protein